MTTLPTDVPTATEPTPADQSATFFAALYDSAPTDHHALLWTLQGKHSTWVPLRHDTSGGPACITERAQTLAANGKDVYVAVSVAAQPGLHDTRITNANASGIVGLWADLDIADPDVHKKWNLPPTIEAAFELIDACGVEPTLVVHSGHGLQAWWLFNEYLAFDSEQARLDAAGLAQRWNTTLQVRAAERSWVVDSVFDLARVMRVPGTLNRKGAPVMPVRLLKSDGPRYEPDQIDEFCVDASFLAARGITPTRSYVPDQVDLSDAARIDVERLEALLDNDDVFKATYEMKRKDFTDQSPSSYDMSLATLAARAGWSDSDIATLILHFRRRHKLDVAKAMRPDYINRTLIRARDGLARDESSEALEEVVEALDAAKQSGDDEQVKDARRSALDAVGQQLGIEVLHFYKYLSDPPAFAMVTPTCTIPLGGADGILVWAKFRQAVWENVGHQIDRFKAADWDRITVVIPRAWEEQDVGAEATERGETASWLSTYLAQRPPVDTFEEAEGSEYPFKNDEGRTLLFAMGFKRWLYLTYQERITNKEVGRRLRSFGCEPYKLNVDIDGKRTTRGVWVLPEGWGS